MAFSNIRANNYSIENSNFLFTKEIAGNIIPAIASSTAAVTGISCLQIYTLLQTDDFNLFKNITFNLATSEFELSTPEDKRYIQNIPKTERSAAKIVIPKEFTVWDKIDLYGPNLKIKNIVNFFKEKYNVDVEYINYRDNTIASIINDDDFKDQTDDEDLEKSVEDLMKEKTNFKINEKTKYIELEISGSKLFKILTIFNLYFFIK